LPPKIYFYEPKISGFKIAGKRGSKFFEPPKTNVRYNLDTMTLIEREEKFVPGKPQPASFSANLVIKEDLGEKDEVPAEPASTEESKESENQNKKKKKKGKK
jgi:hypothetical protein